MYSVVKFILCIVLMCISLGETIFVMGPKSIRSNREYTLVASNVFGDNRSDCLLNVRLQGLASNGSSQLNLSQTVFVQQDTNKIVTFKVPSLSLGVHYSITIEGKQPSTSSSVNIDQEVELKYRRSSVTGLIQLNKPVFRPDDILKLRVIVIDADLKPLPHGSRVSVYVDDPFEHFFREWTNVSLTGGVFEAQISIPTLPLLGTYRIEAMANGEFLTLKTFEVRDYELYSIGLNIYPTVVPFVQHQALNLTVKVKNDLGIPISGTMKIDLFLEKDKLDSSSTWDVNGIRQVYLPFTEKLVGLEHTHDVLLNITFTEQHTNRTTTKHHRITVYNYKYKVMHISRLTYRAGSPFTATLKVTHLNNAPANNVTLIVEIGGTGGFSGRSFTTNTTGYITIFIETNETTKLNYLRVLEGNNLKLNKPIYQLKSTSDMFIEVKLLTRYTFIDIKQID
ncbi:ovostatin-like [Anopheles darlingi]|uniref:ovostatin-like n=1 Tax=Anopheles darlingi TaxID=43151 RepID=UPI002100505F|nr:ovostatin-like [Anopheles darlingi]